jgi:hypothetical protein
VPMLAELVELVIGVDTHADTHTAALVAVDTGAVLATITVSSDADGYASCWSWPSGAAGCGRGRSRGPAATAPAWPATSPRRPSWSSSSTGRCVPPAEPGPSPT